MDTKRDLKVTGRWRGPTGGFDRLRAGVLGYEKVHQLYVGGCHAKLYKRPLLLLAVTSISIIKCLQEPIFISQEAAFMVL